MWQNQCHIAYSTKRVSTNSFVDNTQFHKLSLSLYYNPINIVNIKIPHLNFSSKTT